MKSIERKNELLAKLQNKELDMKQFLYECALWGLELECLVDYEVRHYPPPPKEYKEYLELPLDKRIKIPQEFFHQPEIREYLAIKDKVYGDNWSDYQWLQQIKSWIPDVEVNLEHHLKLDQLLMGFRHWFEESSPELDKLKEAFGGKIVDRDSE